MSGLAGEIALRDARAEATVVVRILDGLPSRVPGRTGLWNGGWVVLGRRGPDRPLVDGEPSDPVIEGDGGMVLALDGRIDNADELRAQLGDSRQFRSRCDTEVVLAAYACWGERFVEHLTGAFALVLVDQDRRTVLLARDRLGLKPLYIAEVSGRTRFASTLPALLAGGGIDTSIDGVALHHYLSWHSIVPAPRTILSGVRKLPAATLRVIDSDGPRDRVYWDLPYRRRPEHQDWTPRDWQESVHDALNTAVARHVSQEATPAVLLSGGLDSSLLVAMLAQYSSTPPLTFSIGFDGYDGHPGDEFVYSDAVARAYGTQHHRMHIATSEVAPAVRDAVADMTEPMGTHDATGFHLLSKAVSGHGGAVLCGQGADEVFAGYGYHHRAADLRGQGLLPVLNDGFRDYTDEELRQLVNPGWLPPGNPSDDFLDSRLSQPGADSALDAVLRLDIHTLMIDDPVKRVDSTSRAWGIDSRLPFLDADLVELAAACPPDLKLAEGGKGVLKEIGRRLLPSCVVDRSKGYFPLPGVTGLDQPVRALVSDVLLSPEVRRRGLLKPGTLRQMLVSPESAVAPTGGNRLWQLTVLELWLQANGVRA